MYARGYITIPPHHPGGLGDFGFYFEDEGSLSANAPASAYPCVDGNVVASGQAVEGLARLPEAEYRAMALGTCE